MATTCTSPAAASSRSFGSAEVENGADEKIQPWRAKPRYLHLGRRLDATHDTLLRGNLAAATRIDRGNMADQ